LINDEISLISFTIFCVFSFGIALGLVPSVLAQSFPTELRYTGVGIVYNLSFATTGGLAPVTIFRLISETNNMLVPAIYFTVIAVISLVGLLVYPKDSFAISRTSKSS
jgi:MFS transporter, MHS family, proline/betaine transporter